MKSGPFSTRTTSPILIRAKFIRAILNSWVNLLSGIKPDKKLEMSQVGMVLGLVVFGGLTRMIPHPANLTALLPMALFSGFVFKGKAERFFVPLLTMLMTDFLIGFHWSAPAVYFSFAISIWLARFLNSGTAARAQLSFRAVTFLTLLGSIQFFLITNFSVWSLGFMYPKTLNGLFNCYALGLQFFSNQLFGDLMYSGIIFGVYYFSAKKYSWPLRISVLG